jgi:hypothetical protein
MKRLCPVKPQTKKQQNPSEKDLPLLKVPQFVGNPGWMYLTHNENSEPVAIFADKQEKLTQIYIVLDERLFSDTVFRVVRLGPTLFVVYDIRYLNGKCIYETMNFETRHQRIKDLLSEFHQTDLVALLTPDEVPDTYPIRGYEFYDENPGTIGVFLPVKE